MRGFLVVGLRDGVPYEDPGAEEPICLFAVQEHALRFALALNDCRSKPYAPNGRGGNERPQCEAHSGLCRTHDSYEVKTMEIK